jgi:hypothetical protein
MRGRAVGCYMESVKCGRLAAKPVVIQPECRLVDLYMTVDGVAYGDTKFCCGEGNLSNAAAKAKAIEKCCECNPPALQATSAVLC